MALSGRRGTRPAAGLRAGGRRTAGRRDRPALVPPSAERRLRARSGAVRPVARHAAALPPRGADSDPLRAQPGGGRRAGAVRSAAAARPLRRASRSAVAARLCRSRSRPAMARHAFGATSRTGWQARPSHDPPRACRTAPRTVSLPACAISFTLLILVVAMPAVAQAPPKPANPAKPAVAAGPKELGKFDDWIAATHEEAGQTTCYAFVRAKNSVPALPGSRRGRADRDGTPDRSRHSGDQRRLHLSARTRR